MPDSVYGILEIGFEPRGIAGTKAPEPPVEAAVVIESADGEESIHWIIDPHPGTGSFYKKATILDFGLALEPGDYKIVGLIGQHFQLGDDPVLFPQFRVGFGYATRRDSGYKIATLGFTVPDSGCVHIGRLSVTYFRVSPGSRAEQARVLDQIAKEIWDSIYYVDLRSGSLVAKWAQHRVMYHDEWSDEATSQDCVLGLTKWILE